MGLFNWGPSSFRIFDPTPLSLTHFNDETLNHGGRMRPVGDGRRGDSGEGVIGRGT